MNNYTVQYYALLREERGLSEETLRSAATTPAALYDELAAKHPFSLRRDQLRAVVNDAFAAWDTPLNDGDSVVFIPPVAGG
jgi:molybdopterin converting factor small subunit